jgi:Putative transposase
LAADGTRWVSCRPGFFLSVRVLSSLFWRLYLEKLREAFAAGKLTFFGALAQLADARVFDRSLAELRRVEWVVYAKRPFAGPAAVLDYLGRYTHRVALAGGRVSFRWRDYRHQNKSKVMMLAADEFIRRFLLHTLPDGFHRIRHYGFLANGHRAAKLAFCRRLLDGQHPQPPAEQAQDTIPPRRPERCPCCGGAMVTLGMLPRLTPRQPSLWDDTS